MSTNKTSETITNYYEAYELLRRAEKNYEIVNKEYNVVAAKYNEKWIDYVSQVTECMEYGKATGYDNVLALPSEEYTMEIKNLHDKHEDLTRKLAKAKELYSHATDHYENCLMILNNEYDIKKEPEDDIIMIQHPKHMVVRNETISWKIDDCEYTSRFEIVDTKVKASPAFWNTFCVSIFDGMLYVIPKCTIQYE